MRSRPRAALARTIAIGTVYVLCHARFTFAHGFVGDRFFPPTIATDDPFATDELSLPTASIFKNPRSPPDWENDSGTEFDKEILPRFALGVSDTYINDNPSAQPGVA